MPHVVTRDVFDDREYLDDPEERTLRRAEKRGRKPQPLQLLEPEPAEVGTADGFNPSFTGSRHEREWILTYLRPLYDDQLITDVLRQVKGGKEATVYCCRAHPGTGYGLLAAKVYRPRMFRNLRNDSQYRQGRSVLGDDGKAVRGRREWLAMTKGTRFGKELSHASWLSYEFGTLELLHREGADVPRPLSLTDNAMLMEYRGDEQGAAPTLNAVSLTSGEARPLFDRVMWNVEVMLSHGLIHGDLSAYNILFWQESVTLIDFPQVVNPFSNPDAAALFARDVERVCRYFAQQGVPSDPYGLARSLWTRHVPGQAFAVRPGEQGR